MNEVKGYTLFNDIEDLGLRNRNRAVILANMIQDNLVDNTIPPKIMLTMIEYMKAIPEDQRKDVYDQFTRNLNDRGYAVSH